MICLFDNSHQKFLAAWEKGVENTKQASLGTIFTTKIMCSFVLQRWESPKCHAILEANSLSFR